MFRCRLAVIIATGAVCATSLTLFQSSPLAHTPISQVTWTVDIAPIIQTRCANCHKPGGFGPMPLTTYEESREWAKAIREEVLSGRMPPWQAARGYGDFANDASLTPLEIELLTSWADGATPHGGAVAQRPPSPKTSATVSDAVPFDLPATLVTGARTERFQIATSEAVDRWITGWQFEPGTATLVEEAMLSISGSRVGSWTPIESAIQYPVNIAERLPRGSQLAVDVRYRKTTEAQVDRSRLILYFGSDRSRPISHRSLSCGEQVLARGTDVIAIRPRAAGAGDAIEVVAHLPNGTVQPIVVVPRYAPVYPVTYRLRTPLHLAGGTRLMIQSSGTGCSADIDFLAP